MPNDHRHDHHADRMIQLIGLYREAVLRAWRNASVGLFPKTWELATVASRSSAKRHCLAILLALLPTVGLTACDDAPAPMQVVTGAPKGAPAVLQVALVADDLNDATARVLEHRGASIPLVDFHTLAVAKAGVSTDASGEPLLAFELVKTDAAALAALTRANIGRGLAMLADDNVLLVATIRAELPGEAVVSLGVGATRADVEEMARRLTAPR